MIVDTFIFYNELDVLETRLKNLKSYVDLFVLVESELTHMGQEKPLYFLENKHRYTSYNIRHIIIKKDEMPKGDDPWIRERFQRDYIYNGLYDIPIDSHIMISDVDEIPDMKKVLFTDNIISLHMYMYEYSYDYVFTGENWIGTVVAPKHIVDVLGTDYFRSNRWKFNIIPYAGWHLSSFGDYKHVYNKIKTYAHAMDEKHQGLSEEDFKLFIENGLHSDGINKLVKRPKEYTLPHII
jgi:beta-1,4-mannosyl-glycoprotein beta-1,4-N-acetylglucosaminyltransferase